MELTSHGYRDPILLLFYLYMDRLVKNVLFYGVTGVHADFCSSNRTPISSCAHLIVRFQPLNMLWRFLQHSEQILSQCRRDTRGKWKSSCHQGSCPGSQIQHQASSNMFEMAVSQFLCGNIQIFKI